MTNYTQFLNTCNIFGLGNILSVIVVHLKLARHQSNDPRFFRTPASQLQGIGVLQRTLPIINISNKQSFLGLNLSQ